MNLTLKISTLNIRQKLFKETITFCSPFSCVGVGVGIVIGVDGVVHVCVFSVFCANEVTQTSAITVT